jgi:peroxiredoxin
MHLPRRELWPALITLLLGVPLCFAFAQAMADGELRRREAPLQALLGEPAYRALVRGEKTPLHYLGDDRLAPDFTLPDREGKPWRLSDQRGKLVVLNFWSITCKPCVEELPSLEQLARIMRDRRDVEVVGISTDGGWAEVAALFPPNPALKVVFDPDKKVVRDAFGTRLYPETWIIDKEGVIRMRVDGPRDWASGLAVQVIDQYR